MRRIRLSVLILISLVILVSSSVCVYCGRIGRQVIGPGGTYWICPVGHVWK